MPIIKSEFSCPICKKGTGKLSQIIANAGELQCTDIPQHRWNDTLSFYEMSPSMDFKVEMPKSLPQENHTPITLSVPIGLKQALDTKYGDKAAATMASILMQMIEGDILVIGQTDLERIASKLGKVPSSSSELFGMIYALGEKVAEAEMISDAAQKDLKAYEGLAIGRVVVDLGDQFQNAMGKAKGAELPLKMFIEQRLRSALEDNWF